MLERRKFVRISEDSQISYRVLPDRKTEGFLTRDISQGGIRFFVNNFIPKNTNLKINVTLKKISFYFEAIVQVVWIKKEAHSDRYEIGVEFINIPKESIEHLIEYIKSILKIS